MMWTREEAIEFCTTIWPLCPTFGCYPALTGGLLYKVGERKDCDVVFYRIRQKDSIDVDGLLAALERIGLVRTASYGWLVKAEWNGKPVDLMFPESRGDEYPQEQDIHLIGYAS